MAVHKEKLGTSILISVLLAKILPFLKPSDRVIRCFKRNKMVYRDERFPHLGGETLIPLQKRQHPVEIWTETM